MMVSIVMICRSVDNYDFYYSSSLVILGDIIITYKVDIIIDSEKINIFYCFISIELASRFFILLLIHTLILPPTDKGLLISRTSSVTIKHLCHFFLFHSKQRKKTKTKTSFRSLFTRHFGIFLVTRNFHLTGSTSWIFHFHSLHRGREVIFRENYFHGRRQWK